MFTIISVSIQSVQEQAKCYQTGGQAERNARPQEVRPEAQFPAQQQGGLALFSETVSNKVGWL